MLFLSLILQTLHPQLRVLLRFIHLEHRINKRLLLVDTHGVCHVCLRLKCKKLPQVIQVQAARLLLRIPI